LHGVQEAQNDSPYKLAPAVGSGLSRFYSAAVSPAIGVLLAIRTPKYRARPIAQFEIRHVG